MKFNKKLSKSHDIKLAKTKNVNEVKQIGFISNMKLLKTKFMIQSQEKAIIKSNQERSMIHILLKVVISEKKVKLQYYKNR